MIMSASPNIFRDELFNLSIDVVPRINRSLETGIFFWRRIFSGSASANGGLLPENRRQRLVKNPSRSIRLRDNLDAMFRLAASACLWQSRLRSDVLVDRSRRRVKGCFVDIIKRGD